MKKVASSNDLIGESTRRLNQLQEIFRIAKEYSGAFDSHISKINNIVYTLLCYNEGSEPNLRPKPELDTINVFEEPEIERNRFTFEKRISRSAKKRITFQKASPEIQLPKDLLKIKEEKVQNTSSKGNNPDSDVVDLYNMSLTDKRSDSNQRRFSSERALGKKIVGNPNFNFQHELMQQIFGRKDSESMIDGNSSAFKKKTEGDQFEVSRDQFQRFTDVLGQGEEGTRALQAILEKLYEKVQNNSDKENWQMKYEKKKKKCEMLKKRVQEVESENTELKIKNAVAASANEETRKLNEKLKTSFLTMKDKSGEFENIEQYKQRIESQVKKIEHLHTERDDLAMCLHSANMKLVSLEQDLRNNREEFLELYKHVHGRMSTVGSSVQLRESYTEQDELSYLLNREMGSEYGYRQYNRLEYCDIETNKNREKNFFRSNSNNSKVVSLRQTEKNIGMSYNSNQYKQMRLNNTVGELRGQIRKRGHNRNIASLDFFDGIKVDGYMMSSKRNKDRLHSSASIKERSMKEHSRKSSEPYLVQRIRHVNQKFEQKKSRGNIKFKKHTEIDFQFKRKNDKKKPFESRQSLINRFISQERGGVTDFSMPMEDCIYDTKYSGQDRRRSSGNYNQLIMKRSDYISISDENGMPISADHYSGETNSIDKHNYPSNNQSKNFVSFGEREEFLQNKKNN